MLNDCEFLPTYNTYEDNVYNDFYIPAFRNSKYVDRASAYFSGKALSLYSQGLEVFEQNQGKYRLILSNEISDEDFQQIKDGYEINQSFIDSKLDEFDDYLTLQDIKNLSNLSYLIAKGVIEIRIAFTKKGIFHDKCAVFIDDYGNEVCMRGSNNETRAAIKDNFESFDLTCSWLASDFDAGKIEKTKSYFNKLWENKMEGVQVTTLPDKLQTKIMSYNKGKIIIDKVHLLENCIILDYVDDNMIAFNKLDDKDILTSSPKYRISLRRYVSFIDNYKNLHFRKNYGYVEYQRIIDKMKQFCKSLNLDMHVTERLSKYIGDRNIYIDKRRNLGVAIKNKDNYLLDKLEAYKEIVNTAMSRQLREQQMWDSFFMATMRKSSNFSVPGSGKTSSVYGAFAYMNKCEGVDKIVMIGPLNSFVSWIDEFLECFGDKMPLRYLGLHDPRYNILQKRKDALVFPEKKYNLILINYDLVGGLKHELQEIINEKVLLVFDEVHRIKSTTGVMALNCLDVAKKATRVITMTGTPIPNSYCDIYNNLHLLFNDEYNSFFNFSVEELKNLSGNRIKAVNDAIYPFFCRTTKDQLQVPKANQDVVNTSDATGLENKLLQILKARYAKNPLALIIRILQMESNPKLLLQKLDLSEYEYILDGDDFSEDIDYYDYSDDIVELINSIERTSKYNATIEQIRNLVKQNKNLCLWCIFVDSMNRFSKDLSEARITNCVINGSVAPEERNRLVQLFKEGKIDVLITNPHTLAESVSLHKCCHDAIYFEYSYNLVHLLQSKDRIHRLGLPNNQYTQYYYMSMKYNLFGDEYSLDERIYERLSFKEQRMLDAVDNNVLEEVSTEKEDIDFILGGLL